MKSEDGLNDAQRHFCREYVYDWNGTRAYKVAYPGVSESTAAVNAHKLLSNANIAEYCKALTEDDERYSGISRRYIIAEHKKIVENTIANFRDTWITLKEFNSLTADQKACISEIQTQTRQMTEWVGETPVPITVEFVKIKLYDKQKSLDSLSKMLGYDAPKKIEHSGSLLKNYEIVPASQEARSK